MPRGQECDRDGATSVIGDRDPGRVSCGGWAREKVGPLFVPGVYIGGGREGRGGREEGRGR